MVKLNLLPSLFYFDKKTEQEFQYALNQRSRSNLRNICHITAAVFLFFVITSVFFSAHYRIGDNIQRLVCAGILVFVGAIQSKLNTKYLDVLWFLLGVLLSALGSSFFVSYALRHSELHEGGPMLAAMLIMTIPVLHLGHKLILWVIMFIGLLYIQLFSEISIVWTVQFYILTTFVITMLQRQIDLLLRKQYRYELIEKNKSQTDRLTGVHNRYCFDNKMKKIRTGSSICRYNLRSLVLNIAIQTKGMSLSLQGLQCLTVRIKVA